MICAGIDVAKDKHDCFILSSEGVVLADVFTIPNNLEGFNTLLDKLRTCTTAQDSIKVGLEATGHYSYNILGFLLDNGLATYVLNPLRTNLYRKSLSRPKGTVHGNGDRSGRNSPPKTEEWIRRLFGAIKKRRVRHMDHRTFGGRIYHSDFTKKATLAEIEIGRAHV